MSTNYVITIAREYGSGGREIATKLAEKLGIKCYDKELLDVVSEKKGIKKDVLEKADEKKSDTFLSKRSNNLPAFDTFGRSINDRVYMVQSQVIKDIVANESCIIVGRCANHVLKDHDNVLSIFIKAPKEARIQRISERYHLSEKDAEKDIFHFDKERAAYHYFYTDTKWGDRRCYQMILDSSVLGIDGTVDLIKTIVDKKFNA